MQLRRGDLINKIPQNVIDLAKKLALKSTMKHKIGAVIYNKKKIIGVGYNRWLIIGNYNCNKYNRHSIHAEIDAMLGCDKRELYGSSIYIYRKNGRLAKPCNVCMEHILKSGISNIYWSE